MRLLCLFYLRSLPPSLSGTYFFLSPLVQDLFNQAKLSTLDAALKADRPIGERHLEKIRPLGGGEKPVNFRREEEGGGRTTTSKHKKSMPRPILLWKLPPPSPLLLLLHCDDLALTYSTTINEKKKWRDVTTTTTTSLFDALEAAKLRS